MGLDNNQNLGQSDRGTEALALARRYQTSGPRYTSYPTAPQFDSDFDVDAYRAQQVNNEQSTEPLSLYVHLPFCHDICYYCACQKIVSRKPGIAAKYLQYLRMELQQQAELVGSNRPVTQLHWGGGTPTYLDNGEITELMHNLATHFRLIDKNYREYSIEIDPRTVSGNTLALLKGVGFNRISLGIQDFDAAVQRAVNRVQSYDEIAGIVDRIRALEFNSVSFDLIYGLPFQSKESMTKTLERVVTLRPNRIACYNYAHLPERFTTQRAIDRLHLPSAEEKLQINQLISRKLIAAGYQFIGMDHFVLPTDELAFAQRENRLQRNFQGYSLKLADDLLGVGMSAISQMGECYLQNAADLPSYYRALDSNQSPIAKGYKMKPEDHLRRRLIMSLICDLEVDIAEIEDEFAIDFATYFAGELQKLESTFDDGLLTQDRERLVVTEKGRPFLRNICMAFDAYLNSKGSAQGRQFSSTV